MLFKLKAIVPLGKYSHNAIVPSPVDKYQMWINDMYLHKTMVNNKMSYHIASGRHVSDELVLLTQDELDELSPEFLQYFEVLEHKQ